MKNCKLLYYACINAKSFYAPIKENLLSEPESKISYPLKFNNIGYIL